MSRASTFQGSNSHTLYEIPLKIEKNYHERQNAEKYGSHLYTVVCAEFGMKD
jgi:hypothetical protein